jgi:hypothetical protein
VIDASAVTTEFNTLFETVTSIAEKVDPIKVNETLTATAQALTGLGDRFGGGSQNTNGSASGTAGNGGGGGGGCAMKGGQSSPPGGTGAAGYALIEWV